MVGFRTLTPADTESDPDIAAEGMNPMKRVLLLLAFVSLASIGCQTHSQRAKHSCQNCGPGGHGQYAARGQGCGVQNSADFVPQIPHRYAQQTEPSGPPSGAYAYPYYTTRGPRDFFLDNPSTIGY
jgi:hypothetical protein